MKTTRKITTLGILTALSVILSYLESLIPPFTGIPGVKPGFANIPVLVSMYLLGPAEALGLGLVRVILSGLTFSGLFAMMYSLAGSVLSIAVMMLLKRTRLFSVPAVSISGGVFHNIGQILVACAVTGSAVIYYLPVLIVSGIFTGVITGIIADMAVRRLRDHTKSIS